MTVFHANCRRFAWLGLFLLLAHTGRAQFLNWQYDDILTDLQESGAYPDMVIGPNGDLHVSYWDKTRDQLMYGIRNKQTGRWQSQPVDPQHACGYRSALTLDPNGKAFIAYLENRNGLAYLRMAQNLAGFWLYADVPTHGDIGKYGPDIGLDTYLELSLDIAFARDASIVITWFDGSIFSYEECLTVPAPVFVYPLEYDLDQHGARWKNNQWTTFQLPRYIRTMPRCDTDPDPDDERLGEFCQLFPTDGDSMFLLANSFFNKELMLFVADSLELYTWRAYAIDSAHRVMAPFSPLYKESFCFSDAVLSRGRTLHAAYGLAEAHGLEFSTAGRGSQRNYSYTRYRVDSLGVLRTSGQAYRPYHRDFNPSPRDNHYRSYFGLAARGEDSVFIAHSNVSTREIVLFSSFNGGQSWREDTLFSDFATNAKLKILFDGDSLRLLAYDSERDHLWLASARPGSANWRIYPLTRNRRSGLRFSSAVERPGSGADIVHLAYDESIEGRLYYSRRQGANTLSTALDVPGLQFTGVKIALDAQQRPAIAYTLRNAAEIRFARFDGAGWGLQQIPTTGIPDPPSLVIHNDSAHIFYYDRSLRKLMHLRARLGSSNWRTEVVDGNSARVGQSPHAQAHNGSLHVAYRDVARIKLRYAHRAPGMPWQLHSVTDSGSYAISDVFLALAARSKKPVIGFRDGLINAIYLAEKQDTSWAISEVLPPQAGFSGSPLAVLTDRRDNPWLLYNLLAVREELRLLRRDSLSRNWLPVSVLNNQAEVSGAFDFQLTGQDFYIAGRKNANGNQGLGLLYAPGGITTELDEAPLNDPELRLYPNPANERAYLSCTLPASMPLQVALFDLQGRLRLNLAAGEKVAAGVHTFEMPLSGLAPGLYFCRIQAGEFHHTLRLAVQ